MENDTPETDEAWESFGGYNGLWEGRDFARDMERDRNSESRWAKQYKDERDELHEAIRNLRDVSGRHHTEQACRRLYALLPENA